MEGSWPNQTHIDCKSNKEDRGIKLPLEIKLAAKFAHWPNQVRKRRGLSRKKEEGFGNESAGIEKEKEIRKPGKVERGAGIKGGRDHGGDGVEKESVEGASRKT